MECKKLLFSLLILMLVITMAPRKCIFNLPVIVLFINMLTIWLLHAGEGMLMRISADSDPCDNQIDKCNFKCFSPGKCNDCCKGNGFVHGTCSSLGCYCCKE
jgi:hypothetical protein